jgi:hypothetical protein
MLRPARPLRQGGARAGSRSLAIDAGVFPAALALTLIAWGPAIDGWFLLDDYRWVLPSDRSFDVLRSFVSTWGHGVAYRPVMRVSFGADLLAFGWNAWAWHLHNLVVHALNASGVASSRQAARDWAASGAVVRSVALELKRLYPELPAGSDVVLEGVPRHIGRAAVHVLYARESVLQAYDSRDRHDTRVFFAEDLRSPESYHVRSAARALDRPARYFHFNLATLTLAELPALAGERAHDAPSIR